MTTINALLVANRGEIARRVFRTCRALGITTVAIHTDLDADALHVRDADVAVPVSSYLDAEAVLAAAEQAGADAIHPGYGFLSENAAFARAVAEAGITWIGPAAEVIDAMGRKDKARDIAVAAGVPVVPSYDVSDDPASFAYPVLAKAAAGGGGKGMRVVRSAAELPEALAAAKREALSAFGDDAMIIEKYVERGRHIEVQILGEYVDGGVTVHHFGTRECSVQRRHQKVIEEAPAPGLDEELRERIHAAAVSLGEAVDYTNAGTVEFLLDADTGEFYFLEMNTRLQVEHPVTEIVNGVDLVELQLAVAGADANSPLGDAKPPLGDAKPPVGGGKPPVGGGKPPFGGTVGCAMEARIYAEDAFGGFLPQAGTASVVEWPRAARVDHALESGQVVSTAYDPMLGKVIVHGEDREEARRRLVAALDDTTILGLTTNTGFLRELAASEQFAEPGGIDTAWLDRNELSAPDPTEARQIAARLWLDRHAVASGPLASDGFRMGGPPAPTVVEFTDGTVEMHQVVVPGGREQPLHASRVTAHEVELAHHGQRYLFTRPDAATDHAAAAGDGTITSPMPGTVLDVRVAEGDAVQEGQVLGVVEAMKMELALKAPYDGVVTAVSASVAQQVALGATLFVVEERS